MEEDVHCSQSKGILQHDGKEDTEDDLCKDAVLLKTEGFRQVDEGHIQGLSLFSAFFCNWRKEKTMSMVERSDLKLHCLAARGRRYFQRRVRFNESCCSHSCLLFL